MGTETRVTNYYYQKEHGRIGSVKTGDVRAKYFYDGLDRVTKQHNEYNSAVKLIIETEYYPNSNQIKSVKNTSNDSDYAVTYTYTYDDNGNIRTVSDGTYTTRYSYDGANQLIREDNERAGKSWYWNYYSNGNVRTAHEFDYTLGAPPTNTPVTFTYGDDKWGDLLTKHGSTAFTYDEIGNTLTDGTWTYTWERGRQLKSMAKSGTTWNMTYDADGLRTSRIATDSEGNTGNKYYYYYEGGLLTYMKFNSLVMRFTYDAQGNPVSMTYNGNIYFYVLNLQGDVMALLDSSGNEVVSYHYNAWGKLIDTTASTTGMLYSLALYNPLRYRGYVYDRETGLYYLQSRYYNPEICRFINADKISNLGVDGSVLSYNLFSYCLNNPVMGFDPTGHWDFGWEERAAFGAALLLAGLAIVLAAPTGGSSLVLGSVALSSTSVLATGATLGLAGTVIMGEALIEPTIDYAKKAERAIRKKQTITPVGYPKVILI